jgi:hypothetical protein
VAAVTIDVLDRTPPAISVPSDLRAEAAGPDGAQVSFEVSANARVVLGNIVTPIGTASAG